MADDADALLGHAHPREALRARALWFEAPRRCAIREESLPAPGAGEVRVRSLVSGISRGTELLVYRGEVPASEYQRMRAPFQAGEWPGPVKYGYLSVGRVEQGPEALIGRRVFCLHPHQTNYVVPADAVHLLPSELPSARALLAAQMETALNALWDASPRIGDRIAVVGGGVVGLLVAWLASRMPGVELQLIDTQPARAQTAHALGIDFSLPDAARPDADLVLHASGSGAGLATALRLAGFEAQVIELSWYGQRRVELALGEAFHSRRLQLRSSQVGAVASTQRARWSHARRMALAISLLADPVLDALVTGHTPFEQAPALFERLDAGAPEGLLECIDYPNE